MAHNTRTRTSLAAWASGAVTQAEFNKLDTQAFESINGDQGGVWAPLTEIEIGGAGVYIHDLAVGELSVEELSAIDAIFGVNPGSDFTVNASAAFHAGVEFFGAVTTYATLTAEGDIVLGNSAADDLTVGATSFFVGQATFNNDVTFNDPVDVNDTLTADAIAVLGDLTVGDDLTVTDDVAVGGDLDVTGTTNLVGAVTIQNACTIGSSPADLLTVEAISEFVGNATFNNKVTCGSSDNDELDVVATMILRTAMTFAGNGRVPFRPTTGPDASHVFSVSDGNVIRVPTLTATRTYNVDSSGSAEGDWILFFGDPGQTLNIMGIDTWPNSGTPKYTLVIRVGGSWRVAIRGDHNIS